MYGAIYGDLVGSIYEFDEYNKHDTKRMIKASEDSNLIKEESFISDDTILTISVAEAMLHELDYEKNLKKYILENKLSNRENYFKYNFSPTTVKWAEGLNDNPSYGNGAIMRVSPIATYRDSIISMINDTISSIKPSHNTLEAIKAGLCVSHVIYLASSGSDKEEIKRFIDEKFNYKYDFDLQEKREESKFNYTCNETMPICLYSLFNANSFDEAIRLALSFGKDTDTNCCITGAMAEHLYGINKEIKESVESKLSDDYKKILKKVYKNK